MILGNELLDALPVHLVVWREDGIVERGVIWRDDGFAFDDRPIASAEQTAAGGVAGSSRRAVRERDRPGCRAHWCARSPRCWSVGCCCSSTTASEQPSTTIRSAAAGTLMCHYRHRAHADPFFWPGLQDITAHVDFSAVLRAGVQAGLTLLGYTTQAHFLVNLGITELLARTPPEPAARVSAARRAGAEAVEPERDGRAVQGDRARARRRCRPCPASRGAT